MARIRHLRVRIKELASEAKHIRHEEHQCSGMERWNLQHHRKTVVRPAARKYQLAYACARGRAYARTEPRVRDTGKAKRVVAEAVKIAIRFGADPEEAAAWEGVAVAHLSGRLPAPEQAA